MKRQEKQAVSPTYRGDAGVYLAGTNTIVGGDDPATEGNLIVWNTRDGVLPPGGNRRRKNADTPGRSGIRRHLRIQPMRSDRGGAAALGERVDCVVIREADYFGFGTIAPPRQFFR